MIEWGMVAAHTMDIPQQTRRPKWDIALARASA
jgi:hypothetical protein